MSPEPVCRFLEWDSDFFGCRIARIAPTRLEAADLSGALAWCREEAIACLYFLVDAEAVDSIRLAEDHGFRLVDIRVTLEAGPLRRQAAAEVAGIRRGRPEDLPGLLPIARVSHTDSRFYADAHFKRDRCDALYETWLRNSFEGEAEVVLVGESADRPAGYVSCQLRPDGVGQIGLLGVHEKTRGQGVGGRLVQAALGWFAAHACRRAVVVTQGRNVPAQRLYQGCGFRTRQVQLWYHKWFFETGAGTTS